MDNATPVSRLLLIESALEFASTPEVLVALLGGLQLPLLLRTSIGLARMSSWTLHGLLDSTQSLEFGLSGPDAQIFGSGWQRKGWTHWSECPDLRLWLATKKKGKCDSTALWSYAPAHALWVAFCSRSGPTDRRVVLFTIRPH